MKSFLITFVFSALFLSAFAADNTSVVAVDPFANATIGDVSLLTTTLNLTTKKIDLNIKCSGEQGINFTDVYFGAAPNDLAINFTLKSLQTTLNTSNLTVNGFVIQGRLTFENKASFIESNFSFTGLKNAGVNYTLTAFCTLGNSSLNGNSNQSIWTQPDNGGRPVTFTAIYNSTLDIKDISKYQATALANALVLNGSFVLDQFGNKVVTTVNARSLATVVATNATVSNSTSNATTQNVTITTFVVRNYESDADTAFQRVLDAGNSSNNTAFLTAFNLSLEKVSPGLGTHLQAVSAGNFTAVTPVINFVVTANLKNITCTAIFNTAGYVAVVGDSLNSTINNTYSAKNVLLGTNDKGVPSKFVGKLYLPAAGNATFNFVADAFNTSYNLYFAGQNGVGEYLTYSTVLNTNVTISPSASFGWRFGVLVLAFLGLIFFN